MEIPLATNCGRVVYTLRMPRYMPDSSPLGALPGELVSDSSIAPPGTLWRLEIDVGNLLISTPINVKGAQLARAQGLSIS